MKKILGTIILIGVCAIGYAQDIHFSQFNQSPVYLNPAFSGLNVCDYRMGANLRTQYGSSTSETPFVYKTANAFMDFSMGRKTNYSNFAGIGFNLYGDVAGDINFSTYRGDLSLAYHMVMDGNADHVLSMALTGGFAYRSIDASKATFNSQFVSGIGFDPNGPVETLDNESFTFGDAGLGLMYTMTTRNNHNMFLGAALHHLNQPRQQFYLGESERLYMKVTMHGGGNFKLSDKIELLPSFMGLLQGSSAQLNIGTYIKYRFSELPNNQNGILFGAWGRVNNQVDAAILAVRLDLSKITVGVSYDMNISKFSPASNLNGGPEISIIYNGCYSRKDRPIFCPQL